MSSSLIKSLTTVLAVSSVALAGRPDQQTPVAPGQYASAPAQYAVAPAQYTSQNKPEQVTTHPGKVAGDQFGGKATPQFAVPEKNHLPEKAFPPKQEAQPHAPGTAVAQETIITGKQTYGKDAGVPTKPVQWTPPVKGAGAGVAGSGVVEAAAIPTKGAQTTQPSIPGQQSVADKAAGDKLAAGGAGVPFIRIGGGNSTGNDSAALSSPSDNSTLAADEEEATSPTEEAGTTYKHKPADAPQLSSAELKAMSRADRQAYFEKKAHLNAWTDLCSAHPELAPIYKTLEHHIQKDAAAGKWRPHKWQQAEQCITKATLPKVMTIPAPHVLKVTEENHELIFSAKIADVTNPGAPQARVKILRAQLGKNRISVSVARNGSVYVGEQLLGIFRNTRSRSQAGNSLTVGRDSYTNFALAVDDNNWALKVDGVTVSKGEAKGRPNKGYIQIGSLLGTFGLDNNKKYWFNSASGFSLSVRNVSVINAHQEPVYSFERDSILRCFVGKNYHNNDFNGNYKNPGC